MEDLDGYDGDEGLDYRLKGVNNYDDDYNRDYTEPEDIEDDSIAVKRSAQPDQTSGKSAAAAAMLPAYCDPPNPCPPGKLANSTKSSIVKFGHESDSDW